MTISKDSKYFIPAITILLAMLTAMSPLAIDTYLSSMPIMADYFGVTINLVEITLTVYFLGFAMGNFFGGPLSDAFGRKTLAMTGITLYILSALSIPFCRTIEQVWVLRAVQAFGGGFSSVTAMVFVRDWFKGAKVARLATMVGMVMMFAPLVSPIIGTALGQLIGWQSIFWFLAAYGLVLWVLFYTFMPESREAHLITRRITPGQFFSKYKLFFQSKPAVLLLLATAFSMSGMFVFITSSSFIYLEYFGMKPEVFPILFAANVLLNVVLSLLNNRLLKKYSPQLLLKTGLFAGLVAATLIFIFTVDGEAHFIPVFAGVVFYIGSLGMVFGNATATILNLLPKISGAANAMIGVTRFVVSFLIGSLTAVFYTGNLLPLGISMFVCAVLANGFYWLYKRSERNLICP
ncbi:multidrug effflux MFS transporter [Carboxylicivirga mesophila]|uniref:Multidrug effflux MFS transporter n=1 Tax=Carboxylicivirga mesophila TaxID=1166478 RepID=A0ABS5KF35_9BACT|nr:multidrug effflux MFS transporter [Carboxylicivirga mesophila]MBS2213669.1 multidrug effflux MFS transporter [Carboxylicivirga mesophila]